MIENNRLNQAVVRNRTEFTETIRENG